MELLKEEDTEFLASLEERILKAVEIVAALKKEKAALEQELQAALSAKNSADAALADAIKENVKLVSEMDAMRVERKQVRTRIEKLLGQMDLLSAS
jgi:FtsZ-binding cell division protein ZapB